MTDTQLNEAGAFYFDTYCSIASPCQETLLREALDLCRGFNAHLSKWEPGSDVWKLNESAGSPVAIGPDAETVLGAAMAISRDSGGAFSVFMGAASEMWKRAFGAVRLPEKDALEAAAAAIRGAALSVEDGYACLPAGTQIDLGGIAKGYITDRVADFLRGQGVKSALLNFGGNIVALGGRPDGQAWRVGLQTPGGEWGRDYWAVTGCRDATLVTSGVYERGFDAGGVRYHHILDPRTGWPVQNGLAAVSAIGRDSMTADGLTTAMFVLGTEAGMRLANTYGYHAVFLDKEGNVTYTEGLDITLV